jgi:hypothetical protein
VQRHPDAPDANHLLVTRPRPLARFDRNWDEQKVSGRRSSALGTTKVSHLERPPVGPDTYLKQAFPNGLPAPSGVGINPILFSTSLRRRC